MKKINIFLLIAGLVIGDALGVPVEFKNPDELNCHAFAKEMTLKEDISLCHVVGQACGVVHTVGHAIGFSIYELTSIVYKYGIENCQEAVEKRCQEYMDRLIYWKQHYQEYDGKWENFLESR